MILLSSQNSIRYFARRMDGKSQGWFLTMANASGDDHLSGPSGVCHDRTKQVSSIRKRRCQAPHSVAPVITLAIRSACLKPSSSWTQEICSVAWLMRLVSRVFPTCTGAGKGASHLRAARHGSIPQACGASAYLGKALRPRRRQSDLSGQRHAHRRSRLRMCTVFHQGKYESCGFRTADSAFLEAEEPQDVPPQNPEIPAFRTAASDVPEPQDPGASNTDFSQPDIAFSDVSPSVPSEDGPADDEKELTGILDACELSYFEPEVARVFENAIERLFYSDNLRIGQAVLPRSRVRSRLHRLNYFVLQEAEIKLHANRNVPVRDSTKYVMSTIYNCITETESDLLVDPYLNSLRSPPGKGRG